MLCFVEVFGIAKVCELNNIQLNSMKSNKRLRDEFEDLAIQFQRRGNRQEIQ